MTQPQSTPGTLYIVATPIGNLQDMTPRAREVLAAVAIIAAEDTRHSGKLLKYFNITTPQISLHDHNEASRTPDLLAKLRAGQDIALISDAGTPLISDPGFTLVRAAREAGITITPIPGACAIITALSAAGLPTDRFVFEGFLSAKSQARQNQLAALRHETRTLVFYESVHRLPATLADMATAFGEQRYAVIGRELTKLHEAFYAGALAELRTQVESNADIGKGELVLLVAGAGKRPDNELQHAEQILDTLLTELPVKQAAALAAKLTGIKKNRLYSLALEKRATS
ncbi:MAG TPA: 16S rRNA (cytidine(1402)-2'-O)-methyltransferase [Gammaproteobacteria bacterium]|nr:16S rRNA (cytidine(1402)-2'-O)-methyltransferase [Gammaproteobacteria bacterium]